MFITDRYDIVHYLTFDIIAQIARGNSFHMIEDEQKHFVSDAVNFSTWGTGVFNQLPCLNSKLGMRVKPYLAKVVFGSHV